MYTIGFTECRAPVDQSKESQNVKIFQLLHHLYIYSYFIQPTMVMYRQNTTVTSNDATRSVSQWIIEVTDR